ncbi:MAG: glycoside hydrolase family 3 protein [Planctomycetota bacterium]
MKPLAVEDLTVEQKVGQMLFARRPRNERNKRELLDMIHDRRLGGLHLSPHEDAGDYLSTADYPLLLADNMESGFEGPEATPLPCQQAIGAIGDPAAAADWARITAIDAKSAGRNTVFGPILDVARNPLSSCVGPRAFGANPELVARLAVETVREYQRQGMVVTAKHFPGFGQSPVDSHIGMVHMTGEKQTLLKRDLLPYQRCIEQADLSGVMVGHIIADDIDSEMPATLSPKVIDLLREMGFDGLVVTDSLAMIGLTSRFGLRRSHELAMAAGNDMIITSYRLSPAEAYGMMLNAYRKGCIGDEQLDASVARVLTAQQRTLTSVEQSGKGDADRQKAAELTRRSISAITSPGASPSIDPQAEHLFLLQVGNTFTDPQTGKVHAEGEDPAGLLDCVARLFGNSRVLRINDFPSRNQMERACVETTGAESVVAVCRSRTDHYMGSSELTRRMLALLDGIGNRLSAVVLLGNAYAARELPPAPRLILGYEGGDAPKAALEALAGVFQPRGTPPVATGLSPAR